MASFIKKNKYFMISIGAIPGALIRWQIDDIFVVNLIGCFVLGFLNSSNIFKKYKLILGIGFCGSMTTFSGWSSQLNNFLYEGLYKLFFVNLISMVFAGIFAVCLGHIFAKKFND